MPQLHLYVSDDEAAEIRRRAELSGLSVSRWLASVVRREVGPDWPEGWFDEVVGAWTGSPLTRPDQQEFEARATLDGRRG